MVSNKKLIEKFLEYIDLPFIVDNELEEELTAILGDISIDIVSKLHPANDLFPSDYLFPDNYPIFTLNSTPLNKGVLE